MEITKELKSDIEINQTQLKNAIRNHQNCLCKLERTPYSMDLQTDVNKAEEEIIFIGVEQKNLLDRLRDEYKVYQKTLETSVIKNGIEDRKLNLSNSFNHARKQNIAIMRSASATSFSDDSFDILSVNSSPQHYSNAVEPYDLSQAEFLTYLSLATHEVYREMQSKRAERKRRSTANPHFLYGNKGWDFVTNNKKKRNTFLISTVSPPHTRHAVKKRTERISPPTVINCSSKPEVNETGSIKPLYGSFPTIPNLPSGLIIERISPDSPDSKSCITCKQPGVLSICEICSNGFHISCHNRPLTQTPRQCPRCITKEVRAVGSLNVPSGMSVSYVTPSEVSDSIFEAQ